LETEARAIPGLTWLPERRSWPTGLWNAAFPVARETSHFQDTV